MTDGGETETKTKQRFSWWNVRDSLTSNEAKKRYDAYCREHSVRLRQLQREASGAMAPSDTWYRER